MELPLEDDWQSKVKDKGGAKVYSLRANDHEVVNRDFDKLHE